MRNPQRAIPISIIISLLACFLAYFGISAIITLMVPYYTIDHNAPVPEVFDAVGWGVARFVIAVGAICGLSTRYFPRFLFKLVFALVGHYDSHGKSCFYCSLLGAMFPMPRVIYAMASDGLIFRFLSYVNERFKTPLTATITAGIMAGKRDT